LEQVAQAVKAIKYRDQTEIVLYLEQLLQPVGAEAGATPI
jgi:hypothetical protein